MDGYISSSWERDALVEQAQRKLEKIQEQTTKDLRKELTDMLHLGFSQKITQQPTSRRMAEPYTDVSDYAECQIAPILNSGRCITYDANRMAYVMDGTTAVRHVDGNAYISDMEKQKKEREEERKKKEKVDSIISHFYTQR